MNVPIVELWLRRLVCCRGTITGEHKTTESTWDLVHVQCYGVTYRARIVSRRVELDGEIVDWTAYPRPIAVALTDGEKDVMLRALAQSEEVARA